MTAAHEEGRRGAEGLGEYSEDVSLSNHAKLARFETTEAMTAEQEDLWDTRSLYR